MDTTRPSADDVCKIGEILYQKHIRATDERDNRGKMLLLDIDSGEYEIDENGREAALRLLKRKPGANLYGLRIGYLAVGRIGGRKRALDH